MAGRLSHVPRPLHGSPGVPGVQVGVVGVSTYSFAAQHLNHIRAPPRLPLCPVEVETTAFYGPQHLLS